MSNESLHTEGVVAEYFAIESQLLSTRTADAYKAVDRSRKSPVCLWLMRHQIGLQSDAISFYLRRMELLDSIQPSVSDTLAYGVDAEGRPFSLFPSLDGHSVIRGNMEMAEAERRFMACVSLIEKIHAQGVTCGDLCGSSFWVNRTGEVRFLGIMGSFESEATAEVPAPPLETAPYLAPEQRDRRFRPNEIQAATDVYALGVLGYRMLSRHYPFGEGAIAIEQAGDLSKYILLKQHVGVPPAWADEVFQKCFSPSPSARYQHAGELREAIKQSRERVLSEQSVPVVGKKEGRAVRPQQPVSEAFRAPSLDVDRGKEEPTPTNPLLYVLYGGGGILFLLIGYLVYHLLFAPSDRVAGPSLQEGLQPHLAAVSDEDLREAIDTIAEGDVTKKERIAQLERVARSDDPIAHDVLIQSARAAESEEMRFAAEKALIDRMQRNGLVRSSEQLRQWLRTLRANEYPSGYEALLKGVDKSMPDAERFAALRRGYASQPQVALRLTAALALDLNQLDRFQPLLSQLVGDSLRLKELKEFSSLSLILAHPELALVFGEDVIQRRDQIPNEDVLWLLKSLAPRGDLNVRAIANIAVERKLLSAVRQTHLILIRDRADLPRGVAAGLIRAAAGVPTKEDISSFGRWYDLASEKVLLAILADLDDRDLALTALDVLAGKSLSIEPSASFVKWLRSSSRWDNRKKFTKLVGALGCLDKLDVEEVNSVFADLDSVVRDSELLRLLLDSENPIVIRAVVSRYGDMLGLGALISLLDNKDKEARMQVVRALKDFNDLGALKLIVDHYEREKDPDVRKVYRETFWMIRQREKGEGSASYDSKAE